MCEASQRGGDDVFQAQINQTDSASILVPIQVFPSQQFQDLQSRYGDKNVKLVHMVRHAEGTHNVNKDYKDSINVDARLTSKGMDQCSSLSRIQNEIVGRNDNKKIAVVTSSMTRCIQTALHSFPDLANNPDIPFIAHEGFRETVNFNCDRRRSKSEISNEFPRVDFSLVLDDEDPIWKSYRERVSDDWNAPMESAELFKVAERGWEGLRCIAQRPEPEIIICSHSAFLRCIFNFGQEGGIPQLPPQNLDGREDKNDHKLFEYNANCENGLEEDMRRNYDNCELRSFCLLFQDGNIS
jgi:broad specificity phosphatase PhoE